MLAFSLSILPLHPYLQDYHSFNMYLPNCGFPETSVTGGKKKHKTPRFPGSRLVTESRPLLAVACFKTLWKDYLIESANVSYP